jgi:tetratricopeptide (TPR) repeat protein
VVVRRTPPGAPPKPIEPVSVLVADFENKTGDTVFDGALEQPLTIAMEGASYVATYARSDAQRVAQQMRNAPRLDAESARLVAFREGVKYVLAGSVSSANGKYTLQVDAIDPAAGRVVQSASASAASKSDVLAAVGSVAAKVRSAIGSARGDQAPAMPAETFTAASFDAMREYSLAQELQSGNDDGALAHYRRAIELDPKFGRAYSGAANVSYRLGRRDEAEDLWKQALSMLDRMTAREKYRTLGAYYLAIPQNYDQGIDNFKKLVSEYPADAAGHTNLALAYFYALDFPKALEEGKRARDLFPKNVTTRNNYALFAMYAGDFATGAAEAKALLADQPTFYRAHLLLAMEAFAKGDLAGATRAYDEMSKAGPRAAAFANMARGDLALYAGRIDDATFELTTGLAADVAAKSTLSGALKQVALAEAEADAGRKPQAIDAARAALKMTRAIAVAVPAARVLVRANKAGETRAIAAELEGHLQKQDRAYGKILLAEAALAENKTNDAIDLLTQARQFADLWLGRFDLGVAYVHAAHYAEAVSELEACEKRRGEATALFLNDVPTVRYLATLPYWIGRAQEGLTMTAPAKGRYENFLNIRKDAAADPLVQDARRRLSAR